MRNRNKRRSLFRDVLTYADLKQCADKNLGTKFRQRGNSLYLAVLIGRVAFATSSPIVDVSSVTTRPSDARLTRAHDDMNELRRAVQSSALIDGEVGLHPGSAESVAAHLSMGMTEQHHRHSGVVHRALEARGHRQDSVRSVVLVLHQSSSAVAELRGSTCWRQSIVVWLPSCRGHA